MPNVVHYREKCIGCNACVELAPEFWEMDEKDGKSNLKKAEKKRECFVLKINEMDKEINELAAEYCPVNIIKVQK